MLQSKTAVFLAQSNHQLLDNSNNKNDAAESISAAYRLTTLKAKQFARCLAKADEQEVIPSISQDDALTS